MLDENGYLRDFDYIRRQYLIHNYVRMAKKKKIDTTKIIDEGENFIKEIPETQETQTTSGVSTEQGDKKIQLKEILDSDIDVKTCLKCEHGVVFKKMLSSIGNRDDMNAYINILCSLAFENWNSSKYSFDMVIDQEFFMEKGKEKDRVIMFIKDILDSDGSQVLLLGPVDIDLLAEMAVKLNLSDKGKEEIQSILSSRIIHMQWDTLMHSILKYGAFHSIDIYADDRTKGVIKEKLSMIDCVQLEEARFVLTETFNDKGNEFRGIEKAFDIYTNNPEKKLILMSLLPFDEFQKHNKDNRKLDFLLAQKNVRFLSLFDPDALKEFQSQTGFGFDKDIPTGLQPRPIKTFDAKILEHLFEPEVVSTIESNESLFHTISFYESKDWGPYLKDLFATLDLKKFNLKNSIVVDVRPEEGRDDIHGINIAYQTLQQHPDAKILLCSLIPIDVFKSVIAGKKSGEYLETLLQGKNVRIIQSVGGNSMTQEQVLEQFDDMYTDPEIEETNDEGKTFQQLAEIESEVAFQKLMESEISHFLHDAAYWIDREKQKEMDYEEKLKYFFFEYQGQKTDKRVEFENRLIVLLQVQHPSFKSLPRENNLRWIIDMYKYSRTQMLPEGTRFEGVFVDRDGCLYDNKKFVFNQKVIDMIKEYEAQGKTITIRTGGNLEMKQKLLDNEPQLKHLIIKSKTDYKGGTVEISIDNDTPEMLRANARLKAETYIRV